MFTMSKALRHRIHVLHLLVAITAVGLLAPACGRDESAPQTEIVISAAASMTDAVRDMASAFEATHPTINLRLNFGSSGSLRQQIEAGAPADVFISASVTHMTDLVAKGLVEASAVRSIASNRMVLITRSGEEGVQSWRDLLGDEVTRVAVGNPAHVPAGAYARQVLRSLAMWEPLQTKLIMGEDVRQVLHFVETGNVDAGIVYRTDAATSPGVHVVAEAPPGTRPEITYPAAVVKESPHNQAAAEFVHFLTSDPGREILRRYGFTEVT